MLAGRGCSLPTAEKTDRKFFNKFLGCRPLAFGISHLYRAFQSSPHCWTSRSPLLRLGNSSITRCPRTGRELGQPARAKRRWLLPSNGHFPPILHLPRHPGHDGPPRPSGRWTENHGATGSGPDRAKRRPGPSPRRFTTGS